MLQLAVSLLLRLRLLLRYGNSGNSGCCTTRDMSEVWCVCVCGGETFHLQWRLLLLVRSQKLSCLSLCNECAMQMQTSLANRARGPPEPLAHCDTLAPAVVPLSPGHGFNTAGSRLRGLRGPC